MRGRGSMRAIRNSSGSGLTSVRTAELMLVGALALSTDPAMGGRASSRGALGDMMASAVSAELKEDSKGSISDSLRREMVGSLIAPAVSSSGGSGEFLGIQNQAVRTQTLSPLPQGQRQESGSSVSVKALHEATAPPASVTVKDISKSVAALPNKLAAMDTLRLVALIFTLLGLVVSAYTLMKHLRNFTMPSHQKLVCRILLLVPVYGLSSMISLLDPSLAVALGTLRDCYEALVIYAFFSLLMVYLGGEHAIGEWLELQGHIDHASFVQRFGWRKAKLGHSFLRRVRQGVLQFVFIKPFTAIVSALFAVKGLYHEGSFHFGDAYLYISIVNNISVTLSLYCLVLFYVATEKILKPFRPVSKFFAVKAVVFFSYWQYCLLQVLSLAGFLHSQEQVFTLQSSLICIEMFIAAIAHHFAFPAKDYVLQEDGRSPMMQIVHRHTMFTRARSEDEGYNSGVDDVEDAAASFRQKTMANVSEVENGHDKSNLIPKLIEVLDGRDILKDGKHVFLDKKQSAAELEDI